MPLCCTCEKDHPRSNFSSSQLRKPAGERRCYICVANSTLRKNDDQEVHAAAVQDDEARASQQQQLLERQQVSEENAKKKLSDDAKLVRNAQLVINQLTDANFEVIFPPLLQPAICQPAIAAQVVERVFQTCIEEPKFAHLYARMCKRMAHYELNFLKDNNQQFRRLLVEKVQSLFYQEAQTLEADHLSDEQLNSLRKRKLANIQLVAHLLLTGVLARGVFSALLQTIFVEQQFPQEIQVECGALLIDLVCGATAAEVTVSMEKPTAVNPFHRDQVLPQVLQRINVIKDDKKRFCNRVVFKLMEVLDMAGRGWVPRAGTQPFQDKRRIHMQHAITRELFGSAAAATAYTGSGVAGAAVPAES